MPSASSIGLVARGTGQIEHDQIVESQPGRRGRRPKAALGPRSNRGRR